MLILIEQMVGFFQATTKLLQCTTDQFLNVIQQSQEKAWARLKVLHLSMRIRKVCQLLMQMVHPGGTKFRGSNFLFDARSFLAFILSVVTDASQYSKQYSKLQINTMTC